MDQGAGFGRLYLYFFLGFLFLVLMRWGTNALASFLAFPQFSSRNELTAIDFDFFKSSHQGENYISQGYGSTSFAWVRYIGGRHNGIDIVASFGAPIFSPSDGIVLAIHDQDKYCYKRGYGKFLAMRTSDNSNIFLYAHLNSTSVKEGNAIKKGEKIASVGASGLVTAPHLHFSVFDADNFRLEDRFGCGPGPRGNDINPFTYLQKNFGSR